MAIKSDRLWWITISMVGAIWFVSFLTGARLPVNAKPNVGPFPSYQCEVEPHFTPREEMDVIIQNELLRAKKSVYLSLYGITNPALVETLMYLKRRGVDVQLAVDKIQSSSRYSQADELAAAGIPVYVKRSATLEHNKFAVIDGKVMITGSWNWSRSANKQDNNTVFVRCKSVAERYFQEFQAIKKRDLIENRK